MSSNIYDNDCSIIKKPVTSDEFKTVIDSLRDEITHLKKEIESLKLKNNNDFIIDLVDYNKEDKIFEEKYQDLIKYLNLLLSNPTFIEMNYIEIDDDKYDMLQNCKMSYLSYLKRRNLSIMIKDGRRTPEDLKYLVKYDFYNPRSYIYGYKIL
jgi:hypothetical protein